MTPHHLAPLLCVGLVLAACSSEPAGPSTSDAAFVEPDAGAITFALQVAAEPAEGGEVTLDPAPDDGRYAAGTTVTLTAKPATGWGFLHWDGDAQSVATAVTITIDGDRTVRALFAKKDLTDTTAPKLASMDPANQATCVTTNRSLTLTFSEAMNQGATEEATTITPATEGAFSWSADRKSLTFTPAAPWPEATTIQITIATGAKDFTGNAIKGLPLKLAFSTVGGAMVPGTLECLASWMTGAFDNERQYWAGIQPGGQMVKRIRLRMKRAWADGVPAANGYWLYVEQAVTYGDRPQDEQPPYRQRLYRVTRLANDTFESRIFAFRDRPTSMAIADFESQILSKVTDDADRAFILGVYEKDTTTGNYTLVGYSYNFYRALKIITALSTTVPKSITPENLQSAFLDRITDALLDGLDDAKYQLGSLTAAEGQALVRSMYVANDANPGELILRTQLEVLQKQRVRDVLNATGYNGGQNHDPLDYAGDWQKDKPIDGLTLAAFEEKTGCAVELKWDGASKYAGTTRGKECLNTYGGAAYMRSEVQLTEGSMVAWDRGFSAADVQVWGGDERYQFDKALGFLLQ